MGFVRLSRVLLFVSPLIISLPLRGQTGLATLTGTVTDPSGAIVPNVSVRALHVATGTALSATSSGTGNYTIAQMPIGDYQVLAEANGFKGYRREGISLGAAQVLRLDIALEVGSATESVTITGVFAPAKTPAPVVTRLNQEIVRVLNRPDVKEKFLATGSEVVASTPEALGSAVKSEIERIGKLIREAGIRAD